MVRTGTVYTLKAAMIKLHSIFLWFDGFIALCRGSFGLMARGQKTQSLKSLENYHRAHVGEPKL